MKAIPITIYRSFDGKDFSTVAACKAYEAEHLLERLVGLTLEQVTAAASREDPDLADAFEEFGKRIGENRRAAGDLRRKPKNGNGAHEAPAETQKDSGAIDDASEDGEL